MLSKNDSRPVRSRTSSNRLATVGLFSVLLVVGSACMESLHQAPPPPASRASLGELVYRILHAKLEASTTCPAQYVAALEANHSDFVTTFDFTISLDIQNDLPDVLGGTIQPLVASGDLPALVNQLGESMALLISDSFDPNRDTLNSLVNLANARTMLEDTMVFDLVDAVLSDPSINDKIHSLALLAQEHDGVDYVLDETLGLVSAALAYNNPLACTGLTIPDVQSTVFRTSGFVEDASLGLGLPAFAVRPDVNYNPRVRVDSVTGVLAAPFVDVNPADGVADVNAGGYPIDASGQVIDIPILGSAGNRDVYGRALNEHGGLLYDYYDVKRTTLSYAAQIAADFIAGDYHHDIPAIANAALGTPTTCSYGTPLATCREYGTANNPVADIFFLGTELLRYPALVDLFDALQQLLTTDPNKAETLLMTLGDVATALDSSTLSLTDTALLGNVRDMLPLVDQLFQVQNSAGLTTPRLIANIIHDMGSAKSQIPRQLGWLLEYRTIVNTPSATTPPVGTLVDYSQPRFYSNGTSTIDNRSAAELLLDMVAYADCGTIGPTQAGNTLSDYLYIYLDALFYGGTSTMPSGNLAQVLVNAASKASPELLKSLLGLATWFTDNSGGQGIAAAIVQLGCPQANADALAYHLPAIKSFQNTGALDWVIPVAQVFGQLGQGDVVIALGKQIAADLQQDGTYLNVGTPGTPLTTTTSAVRRLAPALIQMIDTGAVDELLSALDTLYTIQVGANDAVQVMLDIAAYLVRVENGVPTRQGPVDGTSRAGELMKVLGVLGDRVNAAQAGDELSHLVHFLTGYLQRTDDLGGGARRLHFRNLRLLLSIGSELLHDAAQLSPTDFTCYVDELQSRGVDFLVKRDFATIVRIANQLLVSPNAAGLEDWIVSFLRGMPTNSNNEPYGELLQIVASVAAADPNQLTETDLANITHWISGVVGQTTGASAREIIATLDAIVVADTNGAMLQMIRNTINPGPLASGEMPLMTFADIYSDVGGIDANNMCVAAPTVWDVAQLETTISGVLDFIHDDVKGLGAIWDLVGSIAPAEPAP